MHSREQRAEARRATWSGIVARSAAEAEAIKRAHDEATTPAARVEAIWQLVLRVPWGDSDAAEYRLDRSLGRVERRRG
jgi:hypothetical protein